MANENYSSTTEFDVSMIASMVISVIRDRSLSSAYGYYLSLIKDQTGSIAAPPLDDFFSSTVAKRLRLDMRRLGEESEHIVLYSDMGDLFSQLSRLLIACNERLADEEGIIVQADEKIGSLEFSRQVNDGSYIKHLRNAVLHGHFSAQVDVDSPFNTVLHFWDVNPRNGQTTAEFNFTVESLNDVIEILLETA